MKALTHGQFEDAVDDLIVAVQIDRGHETDRDYLLAAYDEQAARIAELEAAMECACDFLDALQKDTGVGDGTAFMLRAVLGRETKHGDDTDAG